MGDCDPVCGIEGSGDVGIGNDSVKEPVESDIVEPEGRVDWPFPLDVSTDCDEVLSNDDEYVPFIVLILELLLLVEEGKFGTVLGGTDCRVEVLVPVVLEDVVDNPVGEFEMVPPIVELKLGPSLPLPGVLMDCDDPAWEVVIVEDPAVPDSPSLELRLAVFVILNVRVVVPVPVDSVVKPPRLAVSEVPGWPGIDPVTPVGLELELVLIELKMRLVDDPLVVEDKELLISETSPDVGLGPPLLLPAESVGGTTCTLVEGMLVGAVIELIEVIVIVPV